MLDATAVIALVRRVLAWANLLFNRIVRRLLRPAGPAMPRGALTDLALSKADLIAENALLRHQLALLKRQSKRPKLKPANRLSLLLLAKISRSWREALLIVQPATLLRWHREGYRLFWKWKSHKRNSQLRISEETIALIRRMWEEKPLWGAERIRGELLKLGIPVPKRTIQRYMCWLLDFIRELMNQATVSWMGGSRAMANM